MRKKALFPVFAQLPRAVAWRGGRFQESRAVRKALENKARRALMNPG
jgi:hypothetical protein